MHHRMASSNPAAWLAGGGEMGKLVRAMDWAKTPLGSLETWPQSLRTTVSLALASNFPISIVWGRDGIQIYNDGYWPICGAKHPHSMGQNFQECWQPAWEVIGEAYARAWAGETTFLTNRRLFIDRNGYLEETFFTFSFSPIRDESGNVGGLFHPVTELTQQSLAERRLQVLRDLADRTARAGSVTESCGAIAATLREQALDVPFALLYRLDAGGQQATLAGCAGLTEGSPAAPKIVNLDALPTPGWPLRAAAGGRGPLAVEDVTQRFGPLVSGPYPESPQTAFILPIHLPTLTHPVALLVAGVSARRALNEPYRNFYRMLGDAVTNVLTNAYAYEAERQRAEALAELDRAKTAFFSNISHELRTPLTLMLGPTEEALAAPEPALRGEDLDRVHRNARRLLKLVNTLLDFARIEAGRIEAHYEPMDLAALTTDLASVFRAAIEKAGLRLVVDCPSLPEPVYVDREMWEKIVLNLLSNAFKFTFEGEITVALRWRDDHVELAVQDTGTGISCEQLPHVFERFHRVPNARSRTHEGTGIGLALVKELVRYLGGSITVDSVMDRGTTFTVRLPTGCAHLPADRLGAGQHRMSPALGAQPYIEEALRWLPEAERQDAGAREPEGAYDPGFPATRPEAVGERARVLVADDNADLNQYLRQLLSPYWTVETVPDGGAALDSARQAPPDLVLADVMMPVLDGFELLRRLRADPATREIPVILLSARAGEEARVEGLAAGADDYLVKPFSARELVARIHSHLQLARVRREAMLRESEARFRTMADHAPVMVWVTEPDGACSFLSQSWYAFTGQTPETGLGSGWVDAVHPDDRAETCDTFLAANARQEAFRLEYRLRRNDGAYRWAINAATPRIGSDGRFLGYIGSIIDITDRKRVEQDLRTSEEKYRTLFTSIDEGFCTIEVLFSEQGQAVDYRFLEANPAFVRHTGLDNAVGRTIRELAPEIEAFWFEIYGHIARTGEAHRFEHAAAALGRHYDVYAFRIGAADEHRVAILFNDISERKRAEEALRAADRRKDEFLAMLAHELRNPLAPIRNGLEALLRISEPNPTRDQVLKMLQRQMAHLVRLVDDLLDISRITRGKIELKKERVLLKSVVDQALEITRPEIEAKRHKLAVALPSAPIWVEADPVRLTQVLANLLNNAAKYMEPGGHIHVAVNVQGGRCT